MQGAAVGSALKPSDRDVQKGWSKYRTGFPQCSKKRSRANWFPTAYSKLRLLGNLLYSSPEFRKMLSDFTGTDCHHPPD